MMKLIKLELQKVKLGWYVSGAVIANVLIAALVCFIGNIEKIEGTAAFASAEEAFVVMGAIVRATFTIFAAVLIAKLVIEEYKNKTVFITFMYPISRKKLMAAKLLIVSGLTFFTMVISNLFVMGVAFGLNTYVPFIPGTLADTIGQQLISIVAFAFAATGTSLIPLYFGMRKQSVPATIVSALLLVVLISSHNPVFSVASIIYIPLSLAAVGIAIAVLAIRKVETTDVL